MKWILLFVFAVIKADGADEGEPCVTNGVDGVCKSLSNCPSARADVNHLKSPTSTCGHDKRPLVCCGTGRRTQRSPKSTGGRVLTTTPRSSAPTTTEHVPKEYDYKIVGNRMGEDSLDPKTCQAIDPNLTTKPTGQKAWDKCLEYQKKYVFPCEKAESLLGGYARKNHCYHNVDELVIGGKDAAKWEFPHMVSLGYKNEQNQIVYQCGGALISEKFVLTAGHCISDTNQNNVSHALIGILRRSEESASNRYGIKRIIQHDSYKSPYKYHDIALLELDKAVPLDSTTVPACLHTGDPVDESRASAAGWGTTSTRRQVNSNILQKVILTKFTTKECSETYEPFRHMPAGYAETSQICYGDRTKSQDTCQGDSGGPLHVKSKHIGCMYIVIGVTSFGLSCGEAGVPGMYTRVSHYLPWIESIVWPN